MMHFDPRRIYIASPLFGEGERDFLENLIDFIANQINLDADRDFFLPHRDSGDLSMTGDQQQVFKNDISHLEKASIVVAVLDGPDVDSGTAAEVGYAYAKGKPIFGLLTDFRAYGLKNYKLWRLNNMIWGMCEWGKRIFRTKEQLSAALHAYLEEKS